MTFIFEKLNKNVQKETQLLNKSKKNSWIINYNLNLKT